jgi:hypothetical protein
VLGQSERNGYSHERKHSIQDYLLHFSCIASSFCNFPDFYCHYKLGAVSGCGDLYLYTKDIPPYVSAKDVYSQALLPIVCGKQILVTGLKFDHCIYCYCSSWFFGKRACRFCFCKIKFQRKELLVFPVLVLVYDTV